MGQFSVTQDYVNGTFFGPLAAPAAGFPAGVYVSAADYSVWAASIEAQRAASIAATTAAGGGAAGNAASIAAAAAADAAYNAAHGITTPATLAGSPYNQPTTPATPQTPAAPKATPTTPPAGTIRLTPATSGTAKYTPQVLGDSYCELYPADPLCEDWGPGFPINTIPFPGSGGGQTIIQTGVGTAEVTAAVKGGLSALWSVAVGAIDLIISRTIREIQNAITSLGNALLAAWQTLSRLFGFVLTFLRHLYNDVIRPIFALIGDMARAMKHIIDNVVLPALKALQNFRTKILALYQRFLRPVLLIIQDLRRMLAILRLFHIKFAEKLDKDLAALESKLTAPLLFLLKYTNAVANWLNLIVTANYLLQRPIFLNSLQAYIAQVFGLQIAAIHRPLTAAQEAAAAKAKAATPSVAESESAGLQYLQTDTGPYAQVGTDATAQLQQYWAQGPV